MDTTHPHNLVKAKEEIIGVKVKSAQKEDLGEIEELMLEKNSGIVSYAVLSFGGFLGLGNKLFAIPWKALHYSTAEEGFILNIDKAKLQDAPGFDKDHWPNMAAPEWVSSIQTFYRGSLL